MSSTALVIIGLVLAVLVLVLFTVKLKIHPFFALIATSATFAIVSGMNMEDMLSAFTSGMGGTIATPMRDSASMFSRWIVLSGISRGTNTSLRPSLSTTSAARPTSPSA